MACGSRFLNFDVSLSVSNFKFEISNLKWIADLEIWDFDVSFSVEISNLKFQI